jgi:hypothetical protein
MIREGAMRAHAFNGKHTPAAAKPDASFRPGGGARSAAAGRSLHHESDRPDTPGGVIAPDGQHSRREEQAE